MASSPEDPSRVHPRQRHLEVYVRETLLGEPLAQQLAEQRAAGLPPPPPSDFTRGAERLPVLWVRAWVLACVGPSACLMKVAALP